MNRDQFRAALEDRLTFRAANGGEITDADLDAICADAGELGAWYVEHYARKPLPRPPARIDVAAEKRWKAQQREDGTA